MGLRNQEEEKTPVNPTFDDDSRAGQVQTL